MKASESPNEYKGKRDIDGPVIMKRAEGTIKATRIRVPEKREK